MSGTINYKSACRGCNHTYLLTKAIYGLYITSRDPPCNYLLRIALLRHPTKRPPQTRRRQWWSFHRPNPPACSSMLEWYKEVVFAISGKVMSPITRFFKVTSWPRLNYKWTFPGWKSDLHLGNQKVTWRSLTIYIQECGPQNWAFTPEIHHFAKIHEVRMGFFTLPRFWDRNPLSPRYMPIEFMGLLHYQHLPEESTKCR